MIERATFCPRCKRMHLGVCSLVTEKRDAKEAAGKTSDRARHGVPLFKGPRPGEILGGDGGHPASEIPEPEKPQKRLGEIPGVVRGAALVGVAGTKFDKVAYQREYMRKRRAKVKKP